MSPDRIRRCAVPIALGVVLTTSCDRKVGTFFGPLSTDAVPTGDLVVHVETTGEAIDEDGYTLTVTGEAPRTVAVNDIESYPDLPVGTRTVELTGVADNCAVEGENPRTAPVPGEVTIRVVCEQPRGDLVVHIETTGESIDEDGYTLMVTGEVARAVAVNDDETYADLPLGTRTVELTGVADNCSVEGENPRDVSVPGEVTIRVVCEEPRGDLVVHVETTGEAIDEDGYTLDVSGQPLRSVTVDALEVYEDLPLGPVTVTLTDVADNCAVQGDNPREASVPGEVTIQVVCEAPRGDLVVHTRTTGEALDPDGYTVNVEGENSRAVGIDDATTYENLEVGARTVELTGVAPNCTVQGENPRQVPVPGETTFEVFCNR